MERTVNVTVNGEFVHKDSKNAGVQGEANATKLHIVMSGDWEAFSKRIIWRDALGEHPVSVLLYNSVKDLASGKNPLVFDTTIPAEPLAVPGWCSFTVEGFRDSTPTAVSITISDTMLVSPNATYLTPTEPTPTQAQQLQTIIDGVVPQVTAIVNTAVSALERAEQDVKVWEVWDEKKKYLPLQKVSRKGSSYICVSANAGVDPSLDVAGTFWLLIAAKGDTGIQGGEGPQGPIGPTGHTGPRGQPGFDGPAGPVGVEGPQGAIGPTGKTGAQGPQGIDGRIGPEGPAGPQGIHGVAVSTAGMVAFNVTAAGILQCTYTGDAKPNYYINAQGHLCLDV
ncbi:MAG: hypothetical protein RR949_01625 [Oscillospiraceae bacterium]